MTESPPRLQRLRRLRRPTRAVLGLLALVLAVRLAWGWWVGRELSKALDDLRSRGELVTRADADAPTARGDAVAAGVVADAVASIVRNVYPPRLSWNDPPKIPPFLPQWYDDVRLCEAVHVVAFARARRARTEGAAAAQGTATAPFVALAPDGAHLLACILADGALHAHATGDDGKAFERLRDAWHVARVLRAMPDLASHAAAVRIEAMACESAQAIASGLAPGKPVPARPGIEAFLADLLDERDLVPRRSALVAAERARALDALRGRAEGTWLIRPLADADRLRAVRRYGAAVAAGAQAHWPAAEPLLAGLLRDDDAPIASLPGAATPRYSRWFAPQDEAPEFAPATFVAREFRILGERRATAVALAMQLRRADRGAFPAALRDLVPAYLPSVPADPWHADGRAIGFIVARREPYRSATPVDRPLLYFGPADVDARPPSEATYGWHLGPGPGGRYSDSRRQFRDLTRF